MLRDFELPPFCRKQTPDHSQLLRIGFLGEQVFEMGNVRPCNEPVHDYPQKPALSFTPKYYPKCRGLPFLFVEHEPAG